VAHLKVEVLDNAQSPALLDKGDDTVISNTPILLRMKCCAPLEKPGAYGNDPCIWGPPQCCPATGVWVCPFPKFSADLPPRPPTIGGWKCDGVVTTIFSSACVKCCDPDLKPGVNANAPCFQGPPQCCPDDGLWVCPTLTLPPASHYVCHGVPTTGPFSSACMKCCAPVEKPGTNANDPCAFGPPQCCPDSGEWTCPFPKFSTDLTPLPPTIGGWKCNGVVTTVFSGPCTS